VSWIFNHLKVGQSDYFHHRLENAVAAYRQRWQIETMYKAMKSTGFNIEDTHLSDIERVGSFC
jgi:IS4 transposase